jgi:hypothetical protein
LSNLTRRSLYPRAMSRRPDPERIYQARRAARIARPRDFGWLEDDAEEAVVALGGDAADEGRQRGSTGFWDGFDEWAAMTRGY